MSKTYNNGVHNLGKQPTKGGTVTVSKTKMQLVTQIKRHGLATLRNLVKMFPKEARQYVRELDIPETN